MDRLLVVNTGSSSIKFAEFAVEGRHLAPRAPTSGSIDHLDQIAPPSDARGPLLGSALQRVFDFLDQAREPDDRLVAIGHRVVHGADAFTVATVIDESVEAEIERLCPLAPLHNPSNLAGIRLARRAYPTVPQVAVFDTAFHASIPPYAASYAIPQDLAAGQRVRRWGFQGTSCAYVARTTAAYLGKALDELQVIICHIGSGASVTAIRDGRSIDTSMGMTPLEGLVMGTRSGDIDPAVVPYLMEVADLSGPEVLDLLTQRSGLLGLCGDSDTRAVRRRAEAGDPSAVLALAVYAHRIRRYVGAFMTQLPDLDAVVFTAGVGEHDHALRHEVLSPLRHLGLHIGEQRNAEVTDPLGPAPIHDNGAAPALLVVPTDEEREIAQQTLRAAL